MSEQPTSGVLGMSGDHVPLPPAAAPIERGAERRAGWIDPAKEMAASAERVAENAAKGAGHWIGAHQLFSIGFVVGLLVGGMLGYLIGGA